MNGMDVIRDVEENPNINKLCDLVDKALQDQDFPHKAAFLAGMASLAINQMPENYGRSELAGYLADLILYGDRKR